MKIRIPTSGGTARTIEIESFDGAGPVRSELWLDVDPDSKHPETVSGTFLDAEAVDKLIEVLREWRGRNP